MGGEGGSQQALRGGGGCRTRRRLWTNFSSSLTPETTLTQTLALPGATLANSAHMAKAGSVVARARAVQNATWTLGERTGLCSPGDDAPCGRDHHSTDRHRYTLVTADAPSHCGGIKPRAGKNPGRGLLGP